ncbi:MAG: NUDIX hydrolase, partial [Acidimicrobiia bacterium]
GFRRIRVSERPRGGYPAEQRANHEAGGFSVLSSSTLCDAGFLSLSRHRVAGPDGDEFDRHVVHHPGAVVVVPILDGDALMVRQYRVAARRELLEVPAGKRDVDGETPEATANRELEEEIGFHAGRLDRLCEFYNSPGFCDEYTHLFLATELEARARTAVSAEEAAMTVERVALDRVDLLIATGEIIDAKSIIGLLLARRFLAGEFGGT